MQELALNPSTLSVDFSNIASFKKDNVNTHNTAGIDYSEKGEYDLAIEAFSEAIKRNSKDVIAYCRRGKLITTNVGFIAQLRILQQ